MIKKNGKNIKYFCSECNAELAENSHTCPKCGANVGQSEDSVESLNIPIFFKRLLVYGVIISFTGWILFIIGILLLVLYFTNEQYSQEWQLIYCRILFSVMGSC